MALSIDDANNAAATGDLSTLSQYIASGASLTKMDMYGVGPLTIACQLGQLSAVELILPEMTNAPAYLLHESLCLACEGGFLPIVSLLVTTMKTDLNMTPSDSPAHSCQDTPLVSACRSGTLDVVRFLVESGADVNGRSVRDSHVVVLRATPLLECSDNGSLEIARYLIEQGADVNLKANNGDTALDRARRRKYKDIVEILEKNGAVGKPVKKKKKLDMGAFKGLNVGLAKGPSAHVKGDIYKE